VVKDEKGVVIEVPVEMYGLGLDVGEVKERSEYVKSHQTICGKEKAERVAMVSRPNSVPDFRQLTHPLSRFEDVETRQWPQTYAIKAEGKDCTTLITKGVVESGFWVMVSDSSKNGVRIRYKVKNILGMDTVKSGEAYVQMPSVEAYEGETFVNLDGALTAPITIAQSMSKDGNKIKISVRQINKSSK
jgi:hypothetical protein